MNPPRFFAFRRRWIVAVLLLVAVALGWMLLGGTGKKDDAALEWVKVTQGSIDEVVTAQGKLEPKEYVDVGAQVSGQLKTLHVEIGDTVKKGDLLAEIDPRVYQARVEADEARLKTLHAGLAEQEAQAAFARQQDERNKRLAKADAVSKEGLEESATNLQVALAKANSFKAQIEEAQSTLSGDQTNLSYTRIFAPMDGTVVTQTTREGQTVNASQQAPVIVQLANLDLMTVRAQVAEADVMRLHEGMDVYFTTLGSTERRWNGKVQQILPSPETINDVVLYNALVDVENKDRQLMTGMSTQMFFELGSSKDVPILPAAALGKRMPKDDNDVGQAYGVKTRSGERTVHVGRMNRTEVEIRDGLAIGDEVAMPVRPALGAGKSGQGRSGGRPVPGGPRL